MFSNVIVDIPFPRHPFVFSQSSCEVSASLTDVGGVGVGATDNSPSQDYTYPDNQTTLSRYHQVQTIYCISICVYRENQLSNY